MPVKHAQAPFTTSKGLQVKVDANLLYVLTILADEGVETQYSCEGDSLGAYICADGRSFGRFIRRVKRKYRRNELSAEAMSVYNDFRFGEYKLQIAHFPERRRFGLMSRYQFDYLRREAKTPERFAFATSWSLKYGYRRTVRWPSKDLDRIERLVSEMVDG